MTLEKSEPVTKTINCNEKFAKLFLVVSQNEQMYELIRRENKIKKKVSVIIT